jgi:hypothetical protein
MKVPAVLIFFVVSSEHGAKSALAKKIMSRFRAELTQNVSSKCSQHGSCRTTEHGIL